MSEELVWQVIKTNNSKQVRRHQPRAKFTIEKGSVINRRRFYDSGYALKKAVDVSPNDDGVPVLSIKNTTPEDARKPDKMWQVYTLTGGVRKALIKTDKVVGAYSPALKKHAMKKVSAMYHAMARREKAATTEEN